MRVGGRELAAVHLITQRTVATATLGQRLRDFLSRPLTLVALAVLVGCSLLLAILRARATRRQPARHERTPRSRERSMIITVTLNAAIDKTLAVPNFRLGRRHRSVEQTTMPGGKGVNVARTLKRLGQPVVATGFAGGPTGTRIVEQLTEESILNDFVRIREESRTNTAVLDPTNGEQTEINERGPAVSAQEVELFCDKLLYLARGRADRRVRRLAAARRRARPLRRR